MPEGFPCYNLLAELLKTGSCQCAGTRKESTTDNPRQLSSVCYRLRTSLRPLQRHPGCDILPSTRLQTLHCTMGEQFGHSERGSSRVLEEVRGGHMSCTPI